MKNRKLNLVTSRELYCLNYINFTFLKIMNSTMITVSFPTPVASVAFFFKKQIYFWNNFKFTEKLQKYHKEFSYTLYPVCPKVKHFT